MENIRNTIKKSLQFCAFLCVCSVAVQNEAVVTEQKSKFMLFSEQGDKSVQLTRRAYDTLLAALFAQIAYANEASRPEIFDAFCYNYFLADMFYSLIKVVGNPPLQLDRQVFFGGAGLLCASTVYAISGNFEEARGAFVTVYAALDFGWLITKLEYGKSNAFSDE